MELLQTYDWPGNVRELRNVLEYAFAIGDGPLLVESDLPPEILSPLPADEMSGAPVGSSAPPAEAAPRSPEAARIVRALERAGGSRARAAQSLGMSRVTLWRRMKQMGLDELG